jgi:quinohemoprotein amine dehydrogenase
VRRASRTLAGTTLILVTLLVNAGRTQQAAPAAAQQAAPAAKPDEGFPITDPTVQKACASCHRADEKSQLSRISFQRNTPEGWQTVIQRMASLNGLKIDPQTARQVVKYLSNNHGLAPEEAKASEFEVERRPIDYKYTANADAETVCTKCHSMGRVISQRRTKSEWELLIAMHRGWYPLVDGQAFRRTGSPPRDPSPDGRPPDMRQPVEKALEHLTKTFPLKTPEWSAWSATMRPARLEGTWRLRGSQPGKGAIYGKVTIARDAAAPDEFTTAISYRIARTGETVTRTGRSIVYTGFQWRGRSTQGTDEATALREVMFVDRDWRNIEGRWFTGGYDELGMDVFLQRSGDEVRVLGTDRTALRVGVAGQELKIYGLNLPAALKPTDVDLGPGLTVSRVVSVTPDLATVVVDVAATATIGSRDLVIAGSAPRPAALAVFDRIDSIKVKPDWAMSRVGGVTFPKMLAQFEAWGFQNGPDGKPDTPDDINLGIVDATWSMEEYTATYDDDDMKYVGKLNEATGQFTPNIEGPNPDRKGSRNNVGDVWVVAKYNAEAGSGKPATTLKARAHLLVTVPLYMRFDPTVGQ